MSKIVAEFFKMRFEPGEPDSATCPSYAPSGIDRYLTLMGRPVSDWPPELVFFCDRGYADDYLSNPLDWFLFSTRVQEALKEIADKDVEFLRARVIEAGTGKELPGYSIMNIVTIRDAFDPEHSVWLPYHHRWMGPSDTKKLAIRRDKVGDANIFRLADEPYNFPIVTRRVKERLEGMGATGFWFPPVLS